MFKKLLLLLLIFSTVSAHPVIFKNGKVFWFTQSPNFNDLRFGISTTNNWLIGGRILEDRKSEETLALINNNYLLKRRNLSKSQANLYFLSSIGLNKNNSKVVGTVGIHGDWENRNFMVMEMLEYYTHSSSFISNTRIAYSPFTVDYTKTSAWLIAQYRIEYFNDDYSYMLIPILRFYKNNYLVELGSNGDDSFLSLMVHF